MEKSKPIMKATLEKPAKMLDPRGRKVLKDEVIAKDGSFIIVDKTEKEDRESNAPKEASPYRKIIWSRKTMQYTVPCQVRDAAMKAAGGAVGSGGYEVKVEWSEELKAIVTKVVPETEVRSGIVGGVKQ